MRTRNQELRIIARLSFVPSWFNNYGNHVCVFGDKIRIDLGPMNMTIVATKDGRPLAEAAMEGAKIAVNLLDEVARHRSTLKRSAFKIEDPYVFPEVVQRMISACLLTQDYTLTPMSAVAGAISDIVAERIEEEGAKKVVVENGGDVAIRLHGNEVAKVGVIPRIGGTEYTHMIEVDVESKIGGISTSGLGGLGFTKGVASAAVAISLNGALADACGTVIGNSTIVEGAKVIYERAEELDPNTDIKGHTVTFMVGQLTRKEVSTCLQNGLKKAKELIEMDVAVGAVIFVQGKVDMIPERIAKPVGLTQASF